MASTYPSALDNFSTARNDSTPSGTTHAADHDNANDALNKIEAELGLVPRGSYATVRARLDALAAAIASVGGGVAGSLSRIFNVEDTAYGAVPDDFYTDGVATSASTTFTSATANFTSADIGKQIMILRAGFSNYQDMHTTITAVTNSTTVTLANAAGRTQSSARFYISRAGSQSTAIQAAIDACAASGGGTVYIPAKGYLLGAGLVLKNRVWLTGAGFNASMLHLANAVNQPIVQNDTTANNSAMLCGVLNIYLDGNRDRQTAVSTTLAANYTAGASSVTLTNAANFLPGGGSFKIGSTWFRYQSKSGNVLNNVEGGYEGTTDASYTSGTTVTQNNSSGIYWGLNPFNAVPTTAEAYDAHMLVQNVHIKNVDGNGCEAWGQAEHRHDNVWVELTNQHGFRTSFDSHYHACTADGPGRFGFHSAYSEVKFTNCKVFYAGNNVAADGYGVMLEGPPTLEEGTKILAGVNIQDCKASALWLHNAQRVIAQVTCSSNGTSSPGTFPAIKMTGVTSNCIIDAVCTERVASPNNAQRNALSITSTCRQNKIRLTHEAATGSAVLTAITAGSDLSGGNDISINGMGGQIVDAFAASYTPDPYTGTTHRVTLTGNVTAVNAPANAHLGCKLRLELVQDATGGRTLPTFNAIYKMPAVSNTGNTASKYWLADFEYDGTNWVCTAIQQWAF